MKQSNRKTRDNGQLKLIISVAIMTNAALMVFAMGVAHKNLSLSNVIEVFIIYAALMGVVVSYWMLINTAKGLDFIGNKIE